VDKPRQGVLAKNGGAVYTRVLRTPLGAALDPAQMESRLGYEVGPNMLNQAPRLSTSTPLLPLPTLLHAVPSTTRRAHTELAVGDSMPNFTIAAPEGAEVSRDDLLGKPYVLRLTRASGSGII
jgi:hypothetical protein